MAFAVICKSCQARFLLNDDLLRRKVAGRVVTVRCRQCHAPIEVDASNMDPKSLPQAAEALAAPEPPPAPTPAPVALKPKAPRPAPAPPRPAAKSTLMGIGQPARPATAPEMVALSPGLLHMSSSAAPALSTQGFPEPPPPPAVEELEGDWEVTETPALAPVAIKVDAGPESVDDFAEELPPSLPPPEEELPSSTGTPSLAALTHHEVRAPGKPNADDFFANMSAAMNGGVAGSAPTIDVSKLEATSSPAPDVDLSAFDVPLAGKQTLPLFSLADDEAKTPTPGLVAKAAKSGAIAAPPARPAPASPSSRSPASVDPPEPQAPRSRRNVVAPATKSDPPPTSKPRRSGLAAPLLLALAAAAGFLIWKRTSAPAMPSAEAEKPRATDEKAQVVPRVPAAVQPPSEPTPPASPAAAEPADDITFESTPVKTPNGSAAAKPEAKPSSATEAETTPRSTEPSAPKPAAPEPSAKEEPKPTPPAAPAPAEPSGPVGPFDRAAAASALTASAAQASACRKEGEPSGVASVVITFAPSGRVTSATIGGPPFAGTATGSCIAGALRKARVPAFEGERVTVSKTIVVQ